MFVMRKFEKKDFKQQPAVAFAERIDAEESVLGMMRLLVEVQTFLLGRSDDEVELIAELSLVKWWIIQDLGQHTMPIAMQAMDVLGAAKIEITPELGNESGEKEKVLN